MINVSILSCVSTKGFLGRKFCIVEAETNKLWNKNKDSESRFPSHFDQFQLNYTYFIVYRNVYSYPDTLSVCISLNLQRTNAHNFRNDDLQFISSFRTKSLHSTVMTHNLAF